MLESSYIVLNKETFHDTCAAYIKNGNLKCILETERVNRHKHAEYMQPEDSLIPYLKDKFNIDNDITIYDKNDICKYRTHHELHAISSFLSSGYTSACSRIIFKYAFSKLLNILFIFPFRYYFVKTKFFCFY